MLLIMFLLLVIPVYARDFLGISTLNILMGICLVWSIWKRPDDIMQILLMTVFLASITFTVFLNLKNAWKRAQIRSFDDLKIRRG